MITIEQYVSPPDMQQAYDLLHSRPDAVILAGGAFTRLTSRKIGLAIDLAQAGLSGISQDGQGLTIGAMTTLRELETSPVLHLAGYGSLAEATGRIAGVQLRNLATVGGSVCGRYGFSDILPLLLALDCTVVLHKAGPLALADWLDRHQPGKERDILERVILPSHGPLAASQALRQTSLSLPILTVAIAGTVGRWRIAVGARPGRAVLAPGAMQILNRWQPPTGLAEPRPAARSIVATASGAADPAGRLAVAEEAAASAAAGLAFGSDPRAGAAYRAHVCRTLLKRLILEVLP